MSDYQRLVELVKHSPRGVRHQGWIEDELFAIKYLDGASKLLELYDSNLKYENTSGSAVAYVLGICDDPPTAPIAKIKTGRNEPPDIDIDFEDKRREEVKEYLRSKWENVASITTYSAFSSRGLVRDLCRVFSIPITEVNRVCKQFNDMDEFVSSPDTKWFTSKYPEVVSLAKKFEGRWRGSSVHAAGMVIASKELNKILPLESRSVGNRESRLTVTAMHMDDCFKMGLIKIDALGIAALTVVSDCLAKIKERHEHAPQLGQVPLDDERVYKSLSEGHTVGVFQAEASPYTTLLKRMKVSNFNELMVSNALVRPGPLVTVGRNYINRKNGVEEVPADHALIREIAGDTYNVFIFQEQLLEALVKIGKFSWPEADKVRKIIGKKRDETEFGVYEQKWMENASDSIGKGKAKKLWSDFLKFSGYAFNKAHACAYSILSYRTAWLKEEYPKEFMYSLFKNEKDMKKITTYMLECKRLGIEILPPDISKSDTHFSIEGDAIRFGLQNIKGVGATAAEEIIKKRPFKSYEDFSSRVERRKVNVRTITLLDKAGCLSVFPDWESEYNPKDYEYDLMGVPKDLSTLPSVIDIDFIRAEEYVQNNVCKIRGFIKEVKKWPKYSRVDIEDETGIVQLYYTGKDPLEEGKIIIGLASNKDLLGFTVEEDFVERIKNGYNLTPFEKYIQGEVFGDEIILYNHGVGTLKDDKSLVLPLYVRKIITKTGKPMVVMVVTDGDKEDRVVIFPKTYTKFAGRMVSAFEPIVIKGFDQENGEGKVMTDMILARDLIARKGLNAP